MGLTLKTSRKASTCKESQVLQASLFGRAHLGVRSERKMPQPRHRPARHLFTTRKSNNMRARCMASSYAAAAVALRQRARSGYSTWSRPRSRARRARACAPSPCPKPATPRRQQHLRRWPTGSAKPQAGSPHTTPTATRHAPPPPLRLHMLLPGTMRRPPRLRLTIARLAGSPGPKVEAKKRQRGVGARPPQRQQRRRFPAARWRCPYTRPAAQPASCCGTTVFTQQAAGRRANSGPDAKRPGPHVRREAVRVASPRAISGVPHPRAERGPR